VAKPARKPKDIVGGHGMSDRTAQKIHRGLVELTGSEDYEGLVIDELIEASKDPSSPFHDQYTWNVKKAAHERWREQARKMVASVRIVIITYEGYQAKAREVVNLQTSSDHQKRNVAGFVSRKAMKTRRVSRQQYIDRALEELWQWCMRHGDINELTKHRRAILRLPDVKR